MMDDDIWLPLRHELERWKKAKLRPLFWLRDDDAVEPTPALDRLLALTRAHAVPVALAVIPAGAGKALAARLEEAPNATAVVHGWSHANHAAAGEKKQELGAHRPVDEVTRELRQGVARCAELFPGNFAPVLVPPWNRIDGNLIRCLPGLGFKALSVFGAANAADGEILPHINTHVDLMDWHGTRCGRPHGELVAAIVEQMQLRYEAGGGAIGILTHHLVHDEGAWTFLERLFAITANDEGNDWASIRDLMVQRSMT
ncbi:polysaccharide deacetylase family protein [Phyllobacterium sp. 0TCS1.6C]|uniref:polysaccharide deacetylase family protein n=1 Tax=unclassified Phyllobacterium TaxID=2638441 RepID=UPI002264FC3E|nr:MULTISPECIES: polysaccharide deacetylase family protein [unclassified Phyllobacterium]MCX8280968.1 polysaccharide deacetylase family protein [Phyllobacterium sp. 0TCS1.6C]MCX8295834.1 polysaccharide deacetylase family protein [Phyllobacterium sp. 0TCS1.6A]